MRHAEKGDGPAILGKESIWRSEITEINVLLLRLSQLRKLEGPNYQHQFAADRKSLFHFDVEISL